MNTKILVSLLVIGLTAIAIGGAFTGAYFSDVETSEDNVFEAGSIDLQIDSTCHYDGMVCKLVDGDYVWVEEETSSSTYPELIGEPCDCTWPEKNLVNEKFFEFYDLKPGDHGEVTISLHVYDNDAWGKMVINNVEDLENNCVEPEQPEDDSCTDANGDGELREALMFSVCLDQGQIPGFQNIQPDGEGGYYNTHTDETEGDNICQEYEPMVITEGPIDLTGETYAFADDKGLKAVYSQYCSNACNNGPCPADGHNNYGTCHGIAADGRLVGSTTYYLAIKWELPGETGNEVQTDSLTADLGFEVTQYRNQNNPYTTSP